MKNSAQTILLLIAAILVSCSKENSNYQIDLLNLNNLVSITESINTNSVNTYMINEGNNFKITYNNGSYYVMNTFMDNRVVTSEFFNSNDELYANTSFEYSSSGELATITNGSYNGNSNYMLDRKIQFEHNGNEILSTETYYNGDETVDYVSLPNVFTLNSNNEIIKFEDFNFGGSWTATYAGGNLATIAVSGYNNKDGSGTFSYSNEVASDAYHKEVYRFGTQWKINTMLYIQVGGFSFKQLAELGTNYLTGYSYIGVDGSETISLDGDYEFDANGRLIKQTKNKLFLGSLENRILTYQYQ